MEAEEGRRRFHEALTKIYFPPPPPPSTLTQPSQTYKDLESVVVLSEGVTDADFSDLVEDDGLEKQECSSSETESDGVTRKLSRAQRKRLRKRKLKEACASVHRRKIIGLLLP